MTTINQFKKLLQEGGLKVTRNRIAVLELLSKINRPVNHADIMNQLPQDSGWDRVTIYRTLTELEDKKIIKSFHSSDRSTYYEFSIEEKCHIHTLCESCGKIECIKNKITVSHFIKVKNFRIRDVEVLMKGLCKICMR